MIFQSLAYFLAVLSIFSSTPILANNCKLPEKYKLPHKTFVINEKLSCASNVFLNAAPTIFVDTENQLTPEEKKLPQATRRLSYILFGDTFAKSKPSIQIKNFQIKGKDGKHEIPVRYYEGKSKGKVILFTHGGGWSCGNLETHDTLCRKLCEATEASVLAVDYRLAPESPYPAALEDAEDAYNYLLNEYGKEFKIYISGDSAGGNIASSLAIKTIKEGKRIPDGAILFYPAFDLRIPEKTTDPYANGYSLTRDLMNTFILSYLGNNYEEANNPLVSPLLASDEELSKFPKTILVSAECDPLTAEGSAFTNRLNFLGVPVNRTIIPSTIHIFVQYFDLFPEAQEAINFVKESFEKLK